ncbi:MAG: hypothetical protein ACE5R6_04415 [Candidatus Heimdallarchaeota archaeon]
MGAGAPVYREIRGQIRRRGGTFSRAGHPDGFSGEGGPAATLGMVSSRAPYNYLVYLRI